MGSYDRMQIARDALTLFMRSLPEGCSFSIIGFGNDFQSYDPNNPIQQYNESTKNSAVEAIKGFEENYGGTEIREPLIAAQTAQEYESGKQKRIFLLTDGDVGNTNEVVNAAHAQRNSTRVFTFGLGSGCDKSLITKVAQAGRGSYTFVRDGGEDLNGQVVRAL